MAYLKLKKLLTLAAVLFTITAATLESRANIRIRFEKGKNSATISGRVLTAKRICYFVEAKASQTLTASVSSRSGFVTIFESGETEYAYVLDVSGKPSVCVDNIGRTTTYTLTVSIN